MRRSFISKAAIPKARVAFYETGRALSIFSESIEENKFRIVLRWRGLVTVAHFIKGDVKIYI